MLVDALKISFVVVSMYWYLYNNLFYCLKHFFIKDKEFWLEVWRKRLSRYVQKQAQRVHGGIALAILNPDAKRGWVINSTPQTLHPRKRDPLPVCRRLGYLNAESSRILRTCNPCRTWVVIICCNRCVCDFRVRYATALAAKFARSPIR
jgi:hypothetical protein